MGRPFAWRDRAYIRARSQRPPPFSLLFRSYISLLLPVFLLLLFCLSVLSFKADAVSFVERMNGLCLPDKSVLKALFLSGAEVLSHGTDLRGEGAEVRYHIIPHPRRTLDIVEMYPLSRPPPLPPSVPPSPYLSPALSISTAQNVVRHMKQKSKLRAQNLRIHNADCQTFLITTFTNTPPPLPFSLPRNGPLMPLDRPHPADGEDGLLAKAWPW